jgi:hypothetical protein
VKAGVPVLQGRLRTVKRIPGASPNWSFFAQSRDSGYTL